MREELIRCLEEFAYNENFWNILHFLDSLEEETSADVIVEKCQCTEENIHKVLTFLRFFKYEFQCRPFKETFIIVPPAEKKVVCIEMSLPEWFAFQTKFPHILGPTDTKSQRILTKKFFNVKRNYPQYDLSNYLIHNDSQENLLEINHGFSQIVKTIETAIVDEIIVGFFLKNTSTVDVYPHRIVFLEERLSVIGEELEGKNLISFSIDEIEDIRLLDLKNYVPNFSQIEVDDFIGALRAVSGNEKRLILKILNSENINLAPNYHYFSSPYLTINSDGHLIWAASVEISDDLFEWLYKMKDHIQIIDNSEIQSEFEEYKKRREAILKKVA